MLQYLEIIFNAFPRGYCLHYMECFLLYLYAAASSTESDKLMFIVFELVQVKTGYNCHNNVRYVKSTKATELSMLSYSIRPLHPCMNISTEPQKKLLLLVEICPSFDAADCPCFVVLFFVTERMDRY